MCTWKLAQLKHKRANGAILNDVFNVNYINVCSIADSLNSDEKWLICWPPSIPPVRSHIYRHCFQNDSIICAAHFERQMYLMYCNIAWPVVGILGLPGKHAYLDIEWHKSRLNPFSLCTAIFQTVFNVKSHKIRNTVSIEMVKRVSLVTQILVLGHFFICVNEWMTNFYVSGSLKIRFHHIVSSMIMCLQMPPWNTMQKVTKIIWKMFLWGTSDR